MEDGPGEHRLSRRDRPALLQRSLSVRRPTARSPLHRSQHRGKYSMAASASPPMPPARSSLPQTSIHDTCRKPPGTWNGHLRAIHWGGETVNRRRRVIRVVISPAKPHPEMGYRLASVSCAWQDLFQRAARSSQPACAQHRKPAPIPACARC